MLLLQLLLLFWSYFFVDSWCVNNINDEQIDRNDCVVDVDDDDIAAAVEFACPACCWFDSIRFDSIRFDSIRFDSIHSIIFFFHPFSIDSSWCSSFYRIP